MAYMTYMTDMTYITYMTYMTDRLNKMHNKETQHRAAGETAAHKLNEYSIHILYISTDYINSLEVEQND